VQVHVDPDILIVDEALAVGDAAFQAKAMTRIQEILARGTSLLFVGHDLNAVRTFCQHAILLEQGRMAMLGAPQDVIEEYLFRVHAKTQAQAQGQPPPIRTAEGFHSEDGAVLALQFGDGVQHLALAFDAPFEVCAHLAVDPALPDVACILDILDAHGVPLSGRRIRLPQRAPGQHQLQLRVRFRAQLAHGIYRIRARLVQAPDLHQHHRRVLCRFETDLSFEVIDNSIEHFNGLFPLPADVHVQMQPDDAP
jgi:lipopolysaccharide transport system ATP-binding protein